MIYRITKDANHSHRLLEDGDGLPFPSTAGDPRQQHELHNSSLTEVYADYEAALDAVDEAMFYSLDAAEGYRDTAGSETGNEGSPPQHDYTLSLCEEPVVVGAAVVASPEQPSVAARAQAAAGAGAAGAKAAVAAVGPQTPRLSRPAQQTQYLQEAVQLNRRNVELEHAVSEKSVAAPVHFALCCHHQPCHWEKLAPLVVAYIHHHCCMRTPWQCCAAHSRRQ